MPKFMTIVGTRPEIIRLSRLIPLLDKNSEHLLVHTGQNYDPALNRVFFDDLGLREPDYYLGVETSSLGSMLAGILEKTETILIKESPDAVLILGDTNSSITALIAKRMGIPVYHMEAGNRSFDENVPEETNRRMVDHIADFNLAYSELARKNLLAEGLKSRQVMVTGSPMAEVLDYYARHIDSSEVLKTLDLKAKQYVLVSAHRQENVDSESRLRVLIQTLEDIQNKWNIPVLVSTHPRTRDRLSKLSDVRENREVIWHEPFNYSDYVTLQKSAFCTISDSGTISEEASILGFPAVTIRDSMERPEALEAGAVIMAGLDSSNVIRAIEVAVGFPSRSVPVEYQVQDFSRRVLGIVQSTYWAHKNWLGLKS
jgi:UDP-N-acetylglucosamine 2-epimerase